MNKRMPVGVVVSLAVLSLVVAYAACTTNPSSPSSASPGVLSTLGGFAEEGYAADRCARPSELRLGELAAITPQGPVELKSTPAGGKPPQQHQLSFTPNPQAACSGKCQNGKCEPIINMLWTLLPADQKVATIVGSNTERTVNVQAARGVAAFTNVTLQLTFTATCRAKCPQCMEPMTECESEPVSKTLTKTITVNPAKAK